jgi:hypothetical protein
MAILDTLRFNTIADSERFSVIEQFVVLTPAKKIGKGLGVEVRRVVEVFTSSFISCQIEYSGVL